MSKEEVEELLSSMNVKIPALEQEDQEVQHEDVPVPGYTQRHTIQYKNPDNTDGAKIVFDETVEDVKKDVVVLGKNAKVVGGGKSSPGKGSFKKGSNGNSSGGGSKSNSKPKAQENEWDRYQKVNSQLKNTSNILSKLEKQQSKLTGKSLLDNLNKQIQQLNKHIDQTKQKTSIAKQEMEEYQTELSKTYGASFDGDGVLTNGQSIYQQELDRYNAAIKKYGSSNKQSAKDALEKAEQRYQKYLDLVQKYDTLLGDTIPQLEADIQDDLDKQIEIKISKLETKVQIKLDLSQAKQD